MASDVADGTVASKKPSRKDRQRDRGSESLPDDEEPDFSDPESYVDNVSDAGNRLAGESESRTAWWLASIPPSPCPIPSTYGGAFDERCNYDRHHDRDHHDRDHDD